MCISLLLFSHFFLGFSDPNTRDFLYEENAPELWQDPERVKLKATIDNLSMPSSALLDTVKLFLPGKVMHMAKGATVNKGCFSKHRVYFPYWVLDRHDFTQVLVSQFMLFNHFPDFIEFAINMALEDLKKENSNRSSVNAVVLSSTNPTLNMQV